MLREKTLTLNDIRVSCFPEQNRLWHMPDPQWWIKKNMVKGASHSQKLSLKITTAQKELDMNVYKCMILVILLQWYGLGATGWNFTYCSKNDLKSLHTARQDSLQLETFEINLGR